MRGPGLRLGLRAEKPFLGPTEFSACKTYRYRLERSAPPEAEDGPVLGFIMVNPSTADESTDDQTVRMVRLFGSRHGYGRILVGNIFAYRSKDIRILNDVLDPVGPENDDHLDRIMREADRCYAGWGAEDKLPQRLRGRWRQVVKIADRVGRKLYCLDHIAGDHPRHPQVLIYKDPNLLWRRPI